MNNIFKNYNSYNGIFIVGKNNSGKTKFLKQHSQNHIVLNIPNLTTDFYKSYRDSFRESNSWFTFTLDSLTQISKYLFPDGTSEILFEDAQDEDLIDYKFLKQFKIKHDNSVVDELTSTGYISLFLIVSYLLHNYNKFKETNFYFLDEIDTYLDISNKQLLIKILPEIIPTSKFVLATHSPFTIIKSPKCLVYEVETHKIYYTNDLGNLDGILKIMSPNYDDSYFLSENFKILKSIYFKILQESYYNNFSEIDAMLSTLDNSTFTYKEKILKNSIDELIRKEGKNI